MVRIHTKISTSCFMQLKTCNGKTVTGFVQSVISTPSHASLESSISEAFNGKLVVSVVTPYNARLKKQTFIRLSGYKGLSQNWCQHNGISMTCIGIGVRANIHLGVKPSFARMAKTTCLSRGPAREKVENCPVRLCVSADFLNV